jgi:phosphotransferase system HPr (HPr) family protein
VTATVTLPADVDLHARPAATFVRTALGFTSTIEIATADRTVDAKSMLAVLSLGAKRGTELTLAAAGDDAAAAVETLTALIAALEE